MKPVAMDPLDAEILSQLESLDPYDQYFGLMSIWDLDRIGLLPAVLPLLQSPYADLRFLTVQIIGFVGEQDKALYGPFLVPLLESPDAEMRQNAAEALGDMDYQPAIPAIERMVRRESDTASALFAQRALRLLRGEREAEEDLPELEIPFVLHVSPQQGNHRKGQKAESLPRLTPLTVQ